MRSEPASASLRAEVRLEAPGGGFVLDATIEAPPGITVLFGPSGAGKSTLLAALAGLVRPNAGRITLGGEVWFDAETRRSTPVHARRVAFVFQSLALFPHMTALANVAYGIDRSLPKAERAERARASLARFRVAHLAARKPATFSGGEAQRVALARALAMSPRVILLDEPFSAMDRELRRELALEVRGIADELGVPVVHVTHHRAEARAIGDRAILLRGGRVEATGSIDALLPASGQPNLEELPVDGFDDTPMVLLERDREGSR